MSPLDQTVFAPLAEEFAGIDAGSTRYETSFDGFDIVWRRWGSGPDVILLHGAYGSWTHWIRNIPALAQQYTVWTPDTPGYGDSSRSKVHDQELSTVGPAFAAGYRELAGESGFPTIVGFSQGGRIAAHVAVALGQSARRLILVAPGGFTSRVSLRGSAARWRNLATLPEIFQAQRRNLELIMFGKPERIDEIALKLYTFDAARSRLRPRPSRVFLMDFLRRLEIPMATIWGSADALHGPLLDERAATLATLEPTPDFRVIDGAGHWVMYEAAERFNAELLDLIGSEG